MELSECKTGDTVWKPAIVGVIVGTWNTDNPKVKVKWKPGAPFAKETESWEDPKDLILVHHEEEPEVKAPSWMDVQPGDKVTFEYLGETFTATAHKSNIGAAWTCVLGTAVAAWKDGGRARLISIEKPSPPLPTKPGSVILLKGVGELAHLSLASNRHWTSDSGWHLTEAQVQGYGWEVAS